MLTTTTSHFSPRMINLSSSVRAVGPEVTLKHARLLSEKLGVTRVTDITRLDQFNVPVYASIRPDASYGSLCVNAGKGLRPIEAQVGAYMEALEFAAAEEKNLPQNSLEEIMPSQINQRNSGQYDVLDFCPRMATSIDLNSPMGAVACEDITKLTDASAPVELICLPTSLDTCLQSVFGSSSNGLCSGNTFEEALIHGVFEVIERDIRSFQSVDDRSHLVPFSSLPGWAKSMCRPLPDAGLELNVRFQENAFGVPYFMATISDLKTQNPIYFSGGYGCHYNPEVALVRAITEAFQSRLSFIHGGRDDLEKRYQFVGSMTMERKREFTQNLHKLFSSKKTTINFDVLPTAFPEPASFEASVNSTLDLLIRHNFENVLTYEYSVSNDHLVFLRVIIPKMEFFNAETRRIGRRLRDHVKGLG